jgi:methionyl-tRNA formyltransferase
MFVMTTKIIFMGTPPFSVPALSALLGLELDIVAVYTQPDKQAGRGQKPGFSAVKEFAVSHGLNVLQPVTLKNEEATGQMKELNPDVAVVAAYGKIIPENILQIPRLGFLNIHPSLLPRHRGATPIPSAILQGDKVTGVSIMLLDAGMDSGSVFRQSEMPVEDTDTAGTLSARLAGSGAELLTEVLPLWIAGKIEPQPQDDSLATYTGMLTKEDGKLDWNMDAQEIWRKVRAFQPWPGCFTTWKGKNVKITGVSPVKWDRPVEAGEVISLPPATGHIAGIGCGKGVLALDRLQMEGKKEMPVEEFVRGQRDFIGGKLV